MLPYFFFKGFTRKFKKILYNVSKAKPLYIKKQKRKKKNEENRKKQKRENKRDRKGEWAGWEIC